MNQRGSRIRRRHLIIGNSAAALNAVKAIRENNSTDHITLVSAEKHYAYSPVLLPYYVSKKIKRSALFLADQRFYKQNGIELVLGNPATKVDPQTQQVHLASNDILEYDNLLIATGSSPKALRIPGEDLAGVFTLKTVDDADKLALDCRLAARFNFPCLSDLPFDRGNILRNAAVDLAFEQIDDFRTTGFPPLFGRR